MLDSSFAGLAKLLADIIVIVGGFGVSYLSTGRYAHAIAEHNSHVIAARTLMRPSGKK